MAITITKGSMAAATQTNGTSSPQSVKVVQITIPFSTVFRITLHTAISLGILGAIGWGLCGIGFLLFVHLSQ